MTDLALITLLCRAVLAAQLPDVAVLASDTHVQGLDVLLLLLQLSLQSTAQSLRGQIATSLKSCNHLAELNSVMQAIGTADKTRPV